MKILWVKTDFLHPTNRGGQIRTLGILRELHRRNEIHYVAFDDGHSQEAVTCSSEYCQRSYPVRCHVAGRNSLKYLSLLAYGAVSKVPVAVERYRFRQMRRRIEQLLAAQRFDALVCDFLPPAANIADLSGWTLFQHNVETVIWRRLAENAENPFERAYLQRQAVMMRAFEARVCRSVRRVVAVSRDDADSFRRDFGARDVVDIPTGVDLDYFTPDRAAQKKTDLVFVGSMDWTPNIDGIQYFVREVLPLLRRRRPGCSLAIVGRRPTTVVQRLASDDPRISVTGTVDDVRPFLWDARLAVVPLRVGGGTRLKIYESMAARVPVVSTTIGAEGLRVDPPDLIRIADTPQAMADQCADLLEDDALRECIADGGWQMVASRFTWDRVARIFEGALA